MKRLADWIGGAVWGVVTYRLWKRWRQPAVATAPTPAAAEPDDRADELRTRLAESRASEEPAPAEPEEPSGSVEPSDSLEERRRQVHEEGRSAIDEMRREE